tara:strand:+ start:243 stop:623 length:381 start_codon:yes stop_codon:yes gene_type:complete
MATKTEKILKASSAKTTLATAIELVEKNRNKDYGDTYTNHKNIAKLWSSFLDVEITPHDVAICMALVKIARIKHYHKKDNYIDIAAYAGIAYEVHKKHQLDSAPPHIRGMRDSTSPFEEDLDDENI